MKQRLIVLMAAAVSAVRTLPRGVGDGAEIVFAHPAGVGAAGVRGRRRVVPAAAASAKAPANDEEFLPDPLEGTP